MTDVEIIRIEPRELVVYDEILLTDFMLKKFCDFVLDEGIENEPAIKLEVDLSFISGKTPTLTPKKQLVLVRSCLSDVIYSLHCLGLWCTIRTVKLYLTEFARLFDQGDAPPGDLIGAITTILNCLYGRLEDLAKKQKLANEDGDTILHGSTKQLKTLIHYIKDFEPPPKATWPICIVHVRRKVIAKVIALWLSEVAANNKEYRFIKPNYIVGSSRKHRNRMTVDNFDQHHEASIKDFRSGKCNTLVISTVNDRCADMLKVNLVILFDQPTRFSDFLRAKANCRSDSSKYIVIINDFLGHNIELQILNYMNMERVYNSINRKEILEPDEVAMLKKLEREYLPYPRESKFPATVYRSIGIINKYCNKLPGDSFTKLSPEWSVKELENEEDNRFYCEVRLPINSPVRQAIIGPQAPTKAISVRLAALTACKVLHEAGELDNNLAPIKKESMLIPWINSKETVLSGIAKGRSIGSMKHRQYYRKRIAEVFSGPLVTEGVDCYLYKFEMILTCPIPDEQNRRGRRIIDPSETNQNYAIVCTKKLPKICSFPVFTRSGEVIISVKLVDDNFKLDADQVSNLRTFHEYTFSKVLRLEKYPTVYDPDNSPFTVLLAPVIDSTDSSTEVDWKFVEKIIGSKQETFTPEIEQRKQFKFNHSDYVDAVVIPWYRLTDRQQFAYYVAEICTHLNPLSPFPCKSSNHQAFVDYYQSKYQIEIFNKDQPVLDVDHTSARLNLLTPRYVNRKGRTLPSSTAKTRRESRESLMQKQLLVPELCNIHPFPASFWRKAVCLPAIFYRLNSLFLAEELRREVAQEIKVGCVEPPPNFNWPQLDFGWSLKDVINVQATTKNDDDDDDEDDDEDDDDNDDRDDVDDDDFGEGDDDGEEEIDDDEEDGYDDVTRYSKNHRYVGFSDWKEEKNKCQSVIRELFVPYYKETNLEEPAEIEQTSGPLKNLNTTNIIECQDIQFTKSFDVTDDEDAKLKEWYLLIDELDARIQKSLTEEPDLFKDDDVELVTVDDSLDEFSVDVHPNFGELLPNRDVKSNLATEEWKNIKFDPTRDEINSCGPGPNVILQALTMSNASDGINLERLETVGDSFLKYSITAYLYCMHPTMHEGKLSYLRSSEISNANLYRLGRSKSLGELMSATKFEPNDNWLAPGYTIPDANQTNGDQHCGVKKEIDKALAEVPYDLLRQHSIPDKSIADCVEALIGAYLTASGSRAALLFMRWLGLRVMPETFDLEADLKDEICGTGDKDGLWHWLAVPPSPLIYKPPIYDPNAPKNLHHPSEEELKQAAIDELNRHYRASNMDKFEEEIQYSFKDKAYLVQAFTHNSYHENHVTDCHQRLEFLGDALLDYLITRYLFEDPRRHSPGTLTDLRSALVNNTFFASLAVKYNFNKYLMYISDDLSHVIDGFVKKFKFETRDTITKGYTLLISEGESEYAEDIEVPKALGDVFESVAGAIYLDSGMSLDQVWQVYFKMMKPEIDYFCSHVPKSPIRELLETMPQNVRFSPSELTPDRKHRVTAEVFGLGRFIGVGRNKHSAKSTAAKRALRMLALKGKIKRNVRSLPEIQT